MAATTAQGKLELVVDEKGLSAGLRFSPSAEGPEYTEDGIRNFLQESGIQFGIDKDAVKKAFASFAAATKPLDPVEVARGVLPVPPEPTRTEWADLPVPEELQYDVSLALEQAPAPEIYVTRIEKIKRSRKVLKKPKIPFLPPKEVTEEVVEKQERREKIYVNPEVKASGWCEAGTLLAAVTPGKPGKPGKDVYGQIISSAEEEQPFYCGRGVQAAGTGYTALETGFFRRGENWVEVLPFAQHQWEVSLSEDHNTCYLRFNPGARESAPPAAADVVVAAENLGYPAEKLIAAQDIQALIAGAVKNNEPLDKVGISVDEDGFFKIYTSEDKLKGFLSIRKRRGAGNPLVLKEVGAAILKSGFKGLNRSEVSAAILKFYKSPEAELKEYLLAEGKEPVAGEDDTFSLKVTFMPQNDSAAISDRVTELKQQGELSFDSWQEFPLTDAGKMAQVRAEQLIGEIVKGKAGEAGADVFGAKIDPPPGKKAPLKIFEGLKIEKSLLVAEIDGVLEVGEIDGVTLLRLHPHRSAAISVRLSEDRMKAFLSVTAPVGSGFPASAEGIRDAVGKAGVIQGIDEEVLTALCERASRGEEINDEVFAEGQAPKDAGAAEVRYSVEFASGNGVTIARDGHADFRTQDRITSIKEGDLIAEVIIPQGASEPGWDVTGKTLTARELKQVSLEAGDNIEVREEEEGITRFYAATSGELIRDKNRLEVKNVHSVAGDVDMKSGNIKFSGTVQVRGSVMPGFVVFSGGDIQIGGIVDGALLSSEGSIFIAHGVKGGGKAVLRSKKDIAAGFVEQAHIMAVGDVRIKNACLRSTVRCNGRLVLQSDKGQLNGGVLKTRRGAEVQTLGHPNGIQTQISFGQDYLVADRIQVEEKEIARTRENVAKIDTILHRLEKAGERNKLARARQEKLKFIKLIEKRSLRLFTLREKFEEHYPSEIVVRGSLYPGVIFESHGRYYEVDSPQSGVVIFFNPEVGKIQQKPIENDTKE